MKENKYEREFSYLQIGFENVDTIEIDSRYVDCIEVRDREEGDSVSQTGDNLDDEGTCVSLHLCINKAVNQLYLSYGAFVQYYVFERLLEFNDITDITLLNYKRRYVDSFRVPWHEDDETENRYQSARINEDGNLEIFIERKEA